MKSHFLNSNPLSVITHASVNNFGASNTVLLDIEIILTYHSHIIREHHVQIIQLTKRMITKHPETRAALIMGLHILFPAPFLYPLVDEIQYRIIRRHSGTVVVEKSHGAMFYFIVLSSEGIS